MRLIAFTRTQYHRYCSSARLFLALLAWVGWVMQPLGIAQGSAATNGATRLTVSNSTTQITTTVEPLIPAPTMTFGLDQVEVLRGTLFGIPLWQYLAFLIYIFLAFYFSKFFDYLVGAQLKRWAAKTTTTLDDLLIDLLHGPLKVLAFVFFLHVGLRVFPWPVWIDDYITKGLYVAVSLSLTY